MTQDSSTLFPYTTTPRRIAGEVIEALRGVEGVHAIALCGSLAGDDADGFSNVDLLVGYEADRGVAWACSDAIELAKPVRYWRPFTGRAPDGRYWFDGESPFNRLDVSFHLMPAYEQRLAEAGRTLEVFQREGPSPGAGSAGVAGVGPGRDLALGEREREASRCVVHLLGATKEYLRGQADEARWDEAYRHFLEGTRGFAPGRRYAGGHLGELVAECMQIRFAVNASAMGGSG